MTVTFSATRNGVDVTQDIETEAVPREGELVHWPVSQGIAWRVGYVQWSLNPETGALSAYVWLR